MSRTRADSAKKASKAGDDGLRDRPPRPGTTLTSAANPQSSLIWLGVAILVLLTFISYWPAIEGGFIWDDDNYVIESEPYFQSFDGLVQLWKPRTTKQYYPAVFTTFWMEYQLWGLDPMGYHVVNVLLHIANALLVWRLCVMIGVPGGHTAGWLIAMIFALHPVHVESVAWITERKNVLSGFFYLIAAAAYLRFDDSLDRPGKSAWGLYIAALLAFVLALLSKTVTCSLPAALILIMLFQRSKMTVMRLAPLVPMFVIGLVLALHTADLERTNVGAEGEDFAFSIAERMLIASKALLFYPYKIVWPWPIMFIYPRWTIDAHDLRTYWSIAAVIIIGIAAVVAYWRTWRGPALALAFYAGTILPALGFFNVYPMIFSFVADHFQYLSSLGIIVLIVGGAAYLLPQARHVLAGALVLPVLAALTAGHSQTYLSAETVFRDTLAKNPDAWMPHNNLSSILTRRAGAALEAGEAEDVVVSLADEAAFHAGEALRVRPNHRPALNNMSEALHLKGRVQNDMILVQRALEFATLARDLLLRKQLAEVGRRQIRDPHSPIMCEAYLQVGRLQERLGHHEDALTSYRAGLEWDDRSPDAHYHLARLANRTNRRDEATVHFQKVLDLDPDHLDALGYIGEVKELAGQFEEAESMYRRAMTRVRTNDEFVHIGFKLARVLTVHRGNEPARAEEAVRLAEELNQRGGPPSPFILGLMSTAYANAGRIDDARRTGETAHELAVQAKLPELAADIRRKLDQLPR